jgi:hypothetical protein
MEPAGWSLAQIKATIDKGEINQVDPKTAERLRRSLTNLEQNTLLLQRNNR